jgi:hypothetical protein
MRYAAVLLLGSLSCFAQSQPACKVTFSVVAKDDLNNTHQGFRPKTLEWFQKKMVKKYPDVCYSLGASPVVMFFSSRPATYHGTRTETSTERSHTEGQITGDVDARYSGTSTSTSTVAVPYDVDYDVLYVSLETKQPDGTWRVVHNFSRKNLHPTFYGICTKNCHPNYANIEDALKWLHEGGLNDPMQGVIQ